MRRYILILGLLIAGSASAQAATLHRHDTGHDVPKVTEAARPSDHWDPWGHRGAYYGPMIAMP